MSQAEDVVFIVTQLEYPVVTSTRPHAHGRMSSLLCLPFNHQLQRAA